MNEKEHLFETLGGIDANRSDGGGITAAETTEVTAADGGAGDGICMSAATDAMAAGMDASQASAAQNQAQGASAIPAEDEASAASATIRALRAELHDLRAGYAVDALLSGCGAKNPAFLKRLIDLHAIPLNDKGEADLRGVQEMLDQLRKTDGYLFAQGTADDSAAAQGGGALYRAPTVCDTDAMSDAEYYAFRRAHR